MLFLQQGAATFKPATTRQPQTIRTNSSTLRTNNFLLCKIVVVSAEDVFALAAETEVFRVCWCFSSMTETWRLSVQWQHKYFGLSCIKACKWWHFYSVGLGTGMWWLMGQISGPVNHSEIRRKWSFLGMLLSKNTSLTFKCAKQTEWKCRRKSVSLICLVCCEYMSTNKKKKMT